MENVSENLLPPENDKEFLLVQQTLDRIRMEDLEKTSIDELQKLKNYAELLKIKRDIINADKYEKINHDLDIAQKKLEKDNIEHPVRSFLRNPNSYLSITTAFASIVALWVTTSMNVLNTKITQADIAEKTKNDAVKAKEEAIKAKIEAEKATEKALKAKSEAEIATDEAIKKRDSILKTSDDLQAKLESTQKKANPQIITSKENSANIETIVKNSVDANNEGNVNVKNGLSELNKYINQFSVSPRVYYIASVKQKPIISEKIPDLLNLGFNVPPVDVQNRSVSITEIHYYSVKDNNDGGYTEANSLGARILASKFREWGVPTRITTSFISKNKVKSIRPMHYDVILASGIWN